MGGYGPPKTPKKCARCGELFMRKSGNGLYCPTCRKVKLREWENESIARNRDRYRAKNRRTAAKLRNKQKLMVINRYSRGMNACICCGEKEPRFLALDHINNDGSEERRRLSWLGSAFYYGWLSIIFHPDIKSCVTTAIRPRPNTGCAFTMCQRPCPQLIDMGETQNSFGFAPPPRSRNCVTCGQSYKPGSGY
jgi:hypothetical protein